jgi:beta-aspartyl-dipeptidase (metallo-type)
VVGCLGVDTTTKTMPDLLAKAKGLKEEGLSAFVWTGGYDVRPRTLTGSVRDDILFVEEVVGAGEVAVADVRSSAPTAGELARLAREAYVGGMLAGKGGLTHVHVGEGPERLRLLREAIEEFGTPPACLYPTHVERCEALMLEAVELSRAGSFVDIDTVEEDLHRWLRFYLDKGGDPARLTASSDASISSPRTLLEQVQGCVLRHGFALERVLPLVTSNPARALKLKGKGGLTEGGAADVLVLRAESLEVREVIAGGRRLVSGGRLTFAEKFLEESNRLVGLEGGKVAGGAEPEEDGEGRG